MAESSRLGNAVSHLRSAYGRPEIIDSPNSWMLFIRVLLVGPSPKSLGDSVSEALNSPSLAEPRATSQTTTGQLVELLTNVPRGRQKASLVRAIADWWLATFGDECSPEWSGSIDSYRESLRKIRGLGPATVDELLMFCGNLAVFPLDRGTVRVAVRHGWLDLPLEDGESQQYFVRGLDEADIDRREFSLLISQVAEAHCGREPNCDGCPLQPLLPPNGPLNPESC